MNSERIALNRRTVLEALGMAGVGLSGGETAGAVGASPSNGVETVTDASRTDGCEGYGVVECDDLGGWVFGHKNYGRIDDHEGTIHVKTFHLLDYLNVEWEKFGNPRRFDDTPGCWRHTFMFSSLGISGFEGDSHRLDKDELFSGSNFEVTVDSGHERLALSARRDSDLSGFFAPENLVDAIESDSHLQEAATEPPDSLSLGENGHLLRRAAVGAGARKEDERDGTDVDWGPFKTATLVGMEHLSERQTLNKLGSAGRKFDRLLTLAGIAHEAFSGNDVDRDDVTPENLGFGHEYDHDGFFRAFGHYVLFDVYAAPARSGSVVVSSGIDFEHSEHGAFEPTPGGFFSSPEGYPPFRVPVRLEVRIPAVFASLRDESGPPGQRFRASVLGPGRDDSATNVGREAYETDVGVPIAEKVIEKGEPTAEFEIDPTPAEAGVPVTFDGSASFDPEPAPHAEIVSYEWRFKPSDAGWDSDAVVPPDGPRTGVELERAFPDAGTYTARLRVTDREGLEHSVTKTFSVDAHEPLSVSIAGPRDVNVGDTETYTAEVEHAVGSVSYDWEVEVLEADGAVVEPEPDVDGATAEIRFFGTASNASYRVAVVATDEVEQADTSIEVVATDHDDGGPGDDDPAPLSVSIDGDSFACPESDASLEADVDGGEGPYEYTWSGDVGFTSGSSAAIPYHPDVATRSASVTVEDDSGQTASASTTVSMFDECPTL